MALKLTEKNYKKKNQTLKNSRILYIEIYV